MSPTAHELIAEMGTAGTNRSGTTFIRKQYTNVAFETAYYWYLGNEYSGLKYTVLINISNILIEEFYWLQLLYLNWILLHLIVVLYRFMDFRVHALKVTCFQ